MSTYFVRFCCVLVVITLGILSASSPLALATISSGQIDDFQAGTAGWGPTQPSSIMASIASDLGPAGVGDDALFVQGGLVRHDTNPLNGVDPSPTDQWNGNWISEGITRIRMDVRNPTSTELNLCLGFAGTGGALQFFSGDTYLSATPVQVPADDQWHSIVFDVTPAAWANYSGSDAATALQDVTHFRVLNNSTFFYRPSGGDMYIDNITALPEPGTTLLLGSLALSTLFVRGRRVFQL